jgi:hypothetical protein
MAGIPLGPGADRKVPLDVLEARPCGKAPQHLLRFVRWIVTGPRTQVYARCLYCDAHSSAVKHDIARARTGLEIDQLPLERDMTCSGCWGTGCETCEPHRSCLFCGTREWLEEHHYAPVEIFGWEMAQLFGTVTLCRTHHSYWHAVMLAHRLGRDIPELAA